MLASLTLGGTAYGLTAETSISTETIQISTASDSSSDWYTYTASTGVLTGSDLSANLGFDLSYADISSETASKLIYVTSDDDSSVTWGFYTTTDGGITGLWQGNAWTNGGSVTSATLAGLDTDSDGIVRLTANITDSGTYLYSGDTQTNQIYSASGLKSSPHNTSTVTLDSSLISNLYLTHNEEGATTYTSNGFSVTYDAGKHINATTRRVQLDGGDNSSAAEASATGNPIFVGGSGQLFLQTWGKGNIDLDNDIYLGSSTHSDVNTYGVIRFGNDGSYTTTLKGDIVILEDTSMKTNGNQAINISGNVTDKKNIDGTSSIGGKKLTIGGSGYTFSGDVDVSSLEFVEGTNATFNKGFAADSITLGNNTTINSGAELTLSVVSAGTGVTLDSAISLEDNAQMTLAGALSLGDNSLTMSSLVLSGELMTEINGLTEGNTVNLFTNVTALTLGSTSYDANATLELGTVQLGTYFSNVTNSDIYLGYDGDKVYAGVMQTPVTPAVPEPTTATLSLLALAALASRRRRK